MSFRYGGKTYSQHGEDILIVDIFAQLGFSKPSYIDLGAHDPDDISTTKLLYERGSRGINVEANPILVKRFQEKRPDDINVCAAIAPPEQEGQILPFYMFDATSGLNTFSQPDAEIYKEQSGSKYTEAMLCEGISLKTILNANYNGRWPEFLNCDVEGYDYEILRTAELLEEGGPVVVCVETRMHDTARMCSMMLDQEYIPYVRMGENVIFIRWFYYRKLKADFGFNDFGIKE